MKNYFVTIFVVLLAYVSSYAALARSEHHVPLFCCFELTSEPVIFKIDPDYYRCRSLNPILTQFYKPLHWVDVKLRPSYWSFEISFISTEPTDEVEAF